MAKKNLAINIFRILLSTALLGWVLTHTQIDDLLATAKQTDWRVGLAALGLFQVAVVVRTVRWQIILRGQDQRVPLGYLLALNYSAMFFNTFLPTGFGGDVVRTVEVSQSHHLQTGNSAAAVLLDRIIGLMSLFMICLIALLFGAASLPPVTAAGIFVIAAGGLVMFLIILDGRLIRPFEPLLQRLPGGKQITLASAAMSQTPKRWLLWALAVSLLHNQLIVVINYLVSVSLRANIDFQFFAIFTPLSVLALVAPSVQGLGVREGVYRYLFAQIGVASVLAITISLGVYAINLVTGLFGGLVYLTLGVRGLVARRAAAQSTST
jgi:glycosyltransferase 2 family protein